MENEIIQDLLLEQANNTHGGRRPDSGRKIKTDKKKAYTTKLRPDQIDWLRSQKNAARTMEDLIDAAM